MPLVQQTSAFHVDGADLIDPSRTIRGELNGKPVQITSIQDGQYRLNSIFNAFNGRIAALERAAKGPKDFSIATYGTHTKRIGLGGNYPDGSLYVEIDRNTIYQREGNTWKFVAGIMQGVYGDRPTDLGTGDAGFTFLATDWDNVTWIWDGEQFLYFCGTYRNTFVNRPVTPNATVTLGVPDDGLLYEASNWHVTWRWHGTDNGWFYQYGVYEDVYSARPTSLDLFGPDEGFQFYATDRKIMFEWTGGEWVYKYGVQVGTLATMVSVGGSLSADESGYQFFETTYEHLHRWTGGAWTWGYGDVGSRGTDWTNNGGAPTAGVWYPCDGSTYNFSEADGTVTAEATVDLTDDRFVYGGTFTGTPQAAERPQWEAAAVTDDESAHTHDIVDSIEVAALGGTPNAAAAQTTTAGTAHHHALSDANAQLKVPGEITGGLPKRIALAWFARG